MRLGVEGPLPLRSSALLPRNPTTTTYYRLAYFYSATLAWFYSALDSLSICTIRFTVERTGRNLQDESIYRRLTDGNARWVSRRWRTKSFSRPW